MTIGTDPEFFVRTKDGKYINAEKMFPGTKEDPYIIESGAGILTDNVAVEFASPVAENGKDLVHKLKHTFHELFRMLPEDMVLDTSPSAIFDEDQLQTEQAQLFGCSPSYDAWELKVNDQPNAENTNMRSIGGHIHVGHKEGDNNDFLLDPYGKIDMVRVMDGIHGIISVVLDSSKEALERKKQARKKKLERIANIRAEKKRRREELLKRKEELRKIKQEKKKQRQKAKKWFWPF